jgi:signal transduction histidine kinase
MKHISSKLILLFFITAIIPLFIFYVISFHHTEKATDESVMAGHVSLARIAALNITHYFENASDIVKHLASQLDKASLAQNQDFLLKKTFLDFPYFHHINLVDKEGNYLATSGFTLSDKPMDVSAIVQALSHSSFFLSPIYIETQTQPVRPAIQIAYPITHESHRDRILVAEINLAYIWNLVQQIQVGKKGVVTLLDSFGNIVGSSDLALLFELKPFPDYNSLKNNLEKRTDVAFVHQEKGEKFLVSASPLTGILQGSVVIKQPTSEAFGIARQLKKQMVLAALAIFVLMILAGALGVRREILHPLSILTAGIKKISSGQWNYRVKINSRDEFRLLGETFNHMGGQLELQANQIRKQERLSLIGRISGGLVHDLKHPIQNIQNWVRLLPTHYQDEEYRENFQQVVDREFKNVDEFFNKLKDFTGEITINRAPLSITSLFQEISDRFKLALDKKKGTFQQEITPPDLNVLADKFLFLRVLSNLVINAIEALPEGGKISLNAKIIGHDNHNRILISIKDTGMGIPDSQLASLFEDFATTKRKGLGLGLAMAKKIIEAHKGNILVSSIQGQGTRFDIDLPNN